MKFNEIGETDFSQQLPSQIQTLKDAIEALEKQRAVTQQKLAEIESQLSSDKPVGSGVGSDNKSSLTSRFVSWLHRTDQPMGEPTDIITGLSQIEVEVSPIGYVIIFILLYCFLSLIRLSIAVIIFHIFE